MTFMISFLCDTDFLISLHLANESTHTQAVNIFQKYNSFLILDITLYEVATVLSRKLNHTDAISLLNLIQENFTDVIAFKEKYEKLTFENYKIQKNKNTSFFDCAVLTVAIQNDYKIASFDKFYPEVLRTESKLG